VKDTPEVRDRLQAAIGKGAEAHDLLRRLDPLFVALRERYRGNLVHSVRQSAEEREIILGASRIAALEDLYETIYQDAVTGARATKAATELEAGHGKH